MSFAKRSNARRDSGQLAGTGFSAKGGGFSMETFGFDDLEKTLESFDSVSALKMIRSALRASSKPVLKTAKSLAPVLQPKDFKKAGRRETDPGTLRDSLHLALLPVSKLRKNVIVLLAVGAEAWYARILEFGQGQLKGRKMAFMRPAADNNKGRVLNLYRTELKKRIDRFVKKQRRGR